MGWPLGENPDRDGALTELSAVLMACPTPLTAALKQLTSADISKGLGATPLANRPAVLRPLGLMITPRTIGQHLCRDVLTRFIRADDHDARHAATALTQAILIDCRMNVFADEFAERFAPSAVRDPVERWSPALVRVAIWANGLASIGDARTWLWAAGQPWFRPDSVTEEHVAAIVAAAKHVVAVSPGYFFLVNMEENGVAQSDASTGEVGDTDEPDGAFAASLPEHENAVAGTPPGSDQRDTADEEDSRMTATAENARGSGDTHDQEVLTSAQLRQISEDLRVALLDAVPAAQRLLDCVTEDRPPAGDDLAVLTATRASFDDAVTSMQAAGASAEADTGAAVRAALDGLVASIDDAPVRARLAQVRNLIAPAGNLPLIDALTTAQQRADTLATAPAWSADERIRAATLAILTELADPTTSPLQVMVLQQKLVQAHPDLALLAISAAQLTLETSLSTDADGPAAAAPDDNTSDPTGGGETTPGANIGTDPVPTLTSAVPSGGGNSAITSGDPALKQVTGDADMNSPAGERPADASEPPAAATRSTRAVATPNARETASVAVSEEVAAHGRLVEGLADLIRAQRFGMAAAVAHAAARPASQQSALRIAGLADAVRSETSAVNAALRGELIELDMTAIADDSVSALLVVASLLRAALVTGEPTVGAVLSELATRVEPKLAAVAEQVGRRALQGVLVGAPPLTLLADVTEVEQSLHAVTDKARAMLRPRTLRFKRATDIAKAWMGPDGLLGRPLTVAATDDRTSVNEVASAIRRLGDAGHVAREIDTLDRKYKGSSGKPIEGAVRQDLVNLVAEAVQTLADWTEAVLSIQRSGTAQQWSTGEVADMRAVVLGHSAAVLTILNAQSEHSDPLLAAASRAAAASLMLTFAVLDGSSKLPSGEPAPAFVITAELLKVPGALIDTALSRVTKPNDTTVGVLLAAARRTWGDAVTTQVAVENFDAAEFILDAAKSGLLPGSNGNDINAATATTVASARSAVHAELAVTREELRTELSRARTNNEVSEEQAGELTSLLRDADAAITGNFAAVRRGLEHTLPSYCRYTAQSPRGGCRSDSPRSPMSSSAPSSASDGSFVLASCPPLRSLSTSSRSANPCRRSPNGSTCRGSSPPFPTCCPQV
jgi:hypothetical protein